MNDKCSRITLGTKYYKDAALMTVALSFMRGGTGTDGVLRARGLVIEDDYSGGVERSSTT